MILIMVSFLASCKASTAGPVDVDFPFRQYWIYSGKDSISALAVDNDWVAVGSAYGLSALDASTGQLLWANDFPISDDSSLAISVDMVVGTDSQQLKAFGKKGEELWLVDLSHLKNRGTAGIVNLSSKYVFIIRSTSWYLETYDVKTGKFGWELPVDRGGAEVHYDSDRDLVYVVNTSSISAYDAANGQVLWENSGDFGRSTYNAGILYYSSGVRTDNYYFSAYEVNLRQEIWRTYYSTKVNAMAIQDRFLLVSTPTGIISINSENGEILWASVKNEEFFAPAVKADGFFFAKGAVSKEISAFSSDGQFAGYLKVGNPPIFAQSYTNYVSGISTSNNLLVFSLNNTVYAYGKK